MSPFSTGQANGTGPVSPYSTGQANGTGGSRDKDIALTRRGHMPAPPQAGRSGRSSMVNFVLGYWINNGEMVSRRRKWAGKQVHSTSESY
jgi:hypothetical protein